MFTSSRYPDHLPVGLPIPLAVSGSRLHGWVEANAAACPDEIAVDCQWGRLTWQELLDAGLMLAGYMQQHLAVRRGERVLLMMRESPQLAIAWYAALRCDAVVVAIAPDCPAEEVAWCVRDSGARVAVTMQDSLSRVALLLGSDGLRGCIVGAYSEFAHGPDCAAWQQAPEHVREPRVPLLQPHVHDFSGALAAGIAPAPPRAMAGDLAVMAYGADEAGKPEVSLLRHGDHAGGAPGSEGWGYDVPRWRPGLTGPTLQTDIKN